MASPESPPEIPAGFPSGTPLAMKGRNAMTCRAGCAACCIAPSISSPIPGMEGGKPAGVRCVQLTPDNLCRLFTLPDRPAVCASLAPSPEMCGQENGEAMEILSRMELLTRPDPALMPPAGD